MSRPELRRILEISKTPEAGTGSAGRLLGTLIFVRRIVSGDCIAATKDLETDVGVAHKYISDVPPIPIAICDDDFEVTPHDQVGQDIFCDGANHWLTHFRGIDAGDADLVSADHERIAVDDMRRLAGNAIDIDLVVTAGKDGRKELPDEPKDEMVKKVADHGLCLREARWAHHWMRAPTGFTASIRRMASSRR